MTVQKALTYVEIDIPYCALIYGVAPCEAVLGVTGDIKCFNSLATCQDRDNFDDEGATLRFAIDSGYLPTDISCIPAVRSISFSPAVVSLGVDLGQRASLKVMLTDHPHSDTGPGGDKYLADRNYDPYSQGSFFGKFRARHPYLRGRSLRLIRGFLGQTLAEMETHHFVVESFEASGATYTLVAKDVIKLADSDRAQAPLLSNGFLNAAITNIATSATLAPSGIGNAEYPASGWVSIGGSEICAFTRSGDVLTLTRAQFNTAAQAHDVQDRVQLCLRFLAQDPAQIIRDLLVDYAGIDPAFIPLTSWLQETAAYLNRLYTSFIAEPTAVKTLVAELIEQAALAVWWDDVTQVIRLQVLRTISTNADHFGEETFLEDTLQTKEQPERRISRVQTYFGQFNPLKKLDDLDNFRSTVETVDDLAELDQGLAIKRIYSRWIPAFGRAVALRMNDLQISRYRDPPRRFNFDLMRGASEASLGVGYQLSAWSFQDATGAAADVPIQITALGYEADRLKVEAEEMIFVGEPEDLTNRTIIVDSNARDFNLRTVHDTLYPVPTGTEIPAVTVTCIVQAGVIVGSNSTFTPAFDTGVWPSGISLVLDVSGTIVGSGGAGGGGSDTGGGGPGGTGGVALKVRSAINLDVASGKIWGGGGGGGGGAEGDGNRGGGGGGGAGDAGGLGGNSNGAAGTLMAGGSGGSANNPAGGGGSGGGPGLSGNNGQSGNGGQGGNGAGPGKAIDGWSLVTVTAGPGDIRGGTIN